MSRESATYRVIEILKDLDGGKLLCLQNLALKYDTSERSIRRDFELIRKIYGDILISPQKGCYQCVSKTLFENIIHSAELHMLKNIAKLSHEANLSLHVDNDVQKALIREDENSPYLFKQKPYEEIFKYREKFSKLEFAVKFRKEIKIVYDNLGKINRFKLKPYKIIFINENFYLASERKGNVILSRIALIVDIKMTGNEFFIDRDMMEYIFYMQSPWAIYKKDFKSHLKEVIIEIPKPQAKYFKLKKFLPSQKILNEDENGNITISYTVTSEHEVHSLIKQWIPFVKVISPNTLVGAFKKIAKIFYGR